MLLLAIDTSTSAITVALHDGAQVLADESVLDPRAHAEHLAPALARVLTAASARPADVTHVVAGSGPGPFTGLRVGLVTARVFAWARGLPTYGLCSLDALAHATYETTPPAARPSRLLVATDARRREVYWATYEPMPDGLVTRLDGPHVSRPADVPPDVAALPCAGRGPELYPDALPHSTGALDVAAGALAELAVRRLAAGLPLEDSAPRYLRRPDAVPTAPKSVSPAR